MATYIDLANIQASTDFVRRTSVAVANYAKFILNEATNVTNHARRFDWAKVAALSPASTASQLAGYIAMDAVFTALPNGTTDSSSLTDAQFDSVVQTAINNTLLSW